MGEANLRSQLACIDTLALGTGTANAKNRPRRRLNAPSDVDLLKSSRQLPAGSGRCEQ